MAKIKPERDIDTILARLFPICRSITGEGVRETLNILREYIPLEVHEIESGTKVFDWVVPNEWNIRDAYIKNPSGKKIVDFKKNNLHVMGYSTPIKTTMKLAELKKHLHSLPDQPDIIPYKTSYYKESWEFCVSNRQLESLKDGVYEVVIDSSLSEGSLTYGELCIPGKSKDEVLISCYICHPSMANDSISCVALTTVLAKTLLAQKDSYYSYRFLFIPETIGAITWLAKNRAQTKHIKHGLVATCVGDSGPFTYKRTRAGNTTVDKAAEKALADSKQPYSIVDFFPWGSDERQFNSPGFNLPVGSLTRTLYGKFAVYHTSGDDLDFVRPQYIAETLERYLDIIFILEHNEVYLSKNPHCEPQLGERGLYGTRTEDHDRASLWLMSYADGKNSLLDIAIRSGINFRIMHEMATILEQHELLQRARES